MTDHYPLSGGDTTMVITLDDVREYIIGMTLADEEVPQGGLVLRAIACKRVAHLWDVKPNDIELQSWDEMHVLIPVKGKEPTQAWEVDFLCCVWCDECHGVAVHQTNFDANLCIRHFNEAWEQEVADLHNDDRAIGLQP